MEPAFNDWRLVSLTPLPSWALVLAALAAAAAVYLAWRGIASEARRARRRVLVGLRIAAAVLAVLFILEPGVELLATTRLRGRVAVLVDESRSMELPASAGGPTRAEVAAALLAPGADRAALESRFQVDYFGFAETAVPSEPAALRGERPVPASAPAAAQGAVERATEGALEGAIEGAVEGAVEGGVDGEPAAPARPERERTLLLPALEEAARAGGGRPLSGVILLSDGADNGGLAEAVRLGGERVDEVRERLRALGAPVFALDPTGGELKDVSLSALRVDDFAFVRNTVDVEVEVSQRGYGNLSLPVLLEREGQVVTTREVAVEAQKPGTVKLSFTPDTTGEFAFTVRVPVQAGEAVTANNARSFVLKVIRDRVRVLHVAGRPSWDERYLRMLLKRDPNVDLISFFILRTPSDLPLAGNDELSLIPFPTNEIFKEQLHSFDLVVFHNFNYRPYRMAHYLRGIADYVREGGSFLMIGGENSFSEGHYARTPIEDVLPVELSPVPQPPTDIAFPPRLTPEGRRHPVTELAPGEAQNEAAWRRLPPLQGANRTTLRGDAQLLLEHPTVTDGGGRPLPVIAVREVGRGRSMAITADSTWMWAFAAARDGVPRRSYDDLYQRAIRWLVRDPELTQVRLQAERDRYTPSEPVVLLLKARSRDYGPAAGARVEVNLHDAQGARQAGRFEGVVGADGTLRFEAGRLPPGPYRAAAVARRDGEELGRAEDVFVVEEGGPELAHPAPRPDLLKLVAASTDGQYRSAQGTRLSELPLRDPQRVEIGQRKARPLWDRLAFLVLLCGVLGTEWFLRRRWGFF